MTKRLAGRKNKLKGRPVCDGVVLPNLFSLKDVTDEKKLENTDPELNLSNSFTC